MKQLIRSLPVFAACVFLSPAADAQTTPALPTAPTPPNPTKADNPPGLISFLLTLGMGAFVLLANAFPTKRSHQD